MSSSNMGSSAAKPGPRATCWRIMITAGHRRSSQGTAVMRSVITETTLVPKTWRHSILIRGHQTIGPDISLAVDLLYKKSRIHSVTGYDLVLAPEAIGLENVSSSEIFGIASSLTAEL